VEPPASAAVDPLAEIDARSDAVSVRAALMQVPQEQRAVLVMAYFRGMTLKEIAEATSAPLGTVKRRAQLGLARLAKTFGATTS